MCAGKARGDAEMRHSKRVISTCSEQVAFSVDLIETAKLYGHSAALIAHGRTRSVTFFHASVMDMMQAVHMIDQVQTEKMCSTVCVMR